MFRICSCILISGVICENVNNPHSLLLNRSFLSKFKWNWKIPQYETSAFDFNWKFSHFPPKTSRKKNKKPQRVEGLKCPAIAPSISAGFTLRLVKWLKFLLIITMELPGFNHLASSMIYLALCILLNVYFYRSTSLPYWCSC